MLPFCFLIVDCLDNLICKCKSAFRKREETFISKHTEKWLNPPKEPQKQDPEDKRLIYSSPVVHKGRGRPKRYS